MGNLFGWRLCATSKYCWKSSSDRTRLSFVQIDKCWRTSRKYVAYQRRGQLGDLSEPAPRKKSERTTCAGAEWVTVHPKLRRPPTPMATRRIQRITRDGKNCSAGNTRGDETEKSHRDNGCAADAASAPKESQVQRKQGRERHTPAQSSPPSGRCTRTLRARSSRGDPYRACCSR